MHVIDKQRSLKSMSMFCFLAQGMHGELGMVPEARQDPTSHSASLESGYPVPRRVMPVGATHQGSPSGQGSSRHSPLSRTPDGRKTESLSLSRARPQSFISRDRCIHASICTLHACMTPSGGAVFRTHVDTSVMYQYVSTASC